MCRIAITLEPIICILGAIDVAPPQKYWHQYQEMDISYPLSFEEWHNQIYATLERS